MDTTTPIQDLDDEFFDPFVSDDAMFGDVVDPFSVMRAYRRKGSVHELEYRTLFSPFPDVALKRFRHFSVFGYDEIAKIFSDPTTFSNAKVFSHNFVPAFGRSLTALDPPEHTAMRRLFQKAFTPALARRWGEKYVAPAVDELISEFEHAGRADLLSGFMIYYPFRAVCRLMGLPERDITIFHRLAQAVGGFAVNVEQAAEAKRKLGAYFAELVALRRSHPGDDIISVLASAEEDGEPAPDEILISVLRQLINAAADTIYRANSNLIVALLNAPEQMAAVTADRLLVPQAIDEGLRWDGPVTVTNRWVNADTVLGGVAIPRGSVVDVVQGSANRDESRFPDPDRFDVFRKSVYTPFVFAHGLHVCMGRHLARTSIEIAMNALLDRLPNLRLDADRAAPVIQGLTFRAPRSIFVRFG